MFLTTSSLNSSKSQIWIICLLLCFFINISLASEEVPQQVQDWQSAAVEYEKADNFSQAHTEYDKIIQAYPNTSYGLDACAKSANLYVRQEQFENILPVVDNICSNFTEQPRLFKTCRTLVEKCMYAKAYPVAESVCTKVQARFSSSPRVVLMIGWRGMVDAGQGNFADAEQMRQTLLQAENCTVSDFIGAMGDIGWGYYCAGEWDEALNTYRMGLNRDSTDPQAVYLQYQIVRTMLTKGDMGAADNEVKTFLSKYGHLEKTPGLVFRLGNEYYKKWNLQGAINVYEMLRSQYSDHELVPEIRGMEIKSYKMLAQHYRRENQPDQAVVAYEAILNRFPDDEQVPSIRDEIVTTYADAGDLVNAQKALQTDIENCPHRLELVRMITRVAVEMARAGNTDTAMGLAEGIFDQHPQSEEHQLFGRMFGYTTQARVYVHQGKDVEAATLVNETMELFKDRPDSLAYHLFGVGEEYFLLGEEALQADDKETADTYFMKAISLWGKMINGIQSPGLGQAYYYTARAYQGMENYDSAVEFYNRVLTDYPNFKKLWAAHAGLAQTYYRMYQLELIPRRLAASEIQNIYDTFVQKWPDSPSVPMIRMYIENTR